MAPPNIHQRLLEQVREWGGQATRGSALGEPGCWHGGGFSGRAAKGVLDAACLPLPTSCPPALPPPPPAPHLQPLLTSLFFLQGLCPNEAELFLTQVTYTALGDTGQCISVPTPILHMSVFVSFSPE